MPNDLFCKSLFIVQYTLGNKINAITLVHNCAIGYGFIDKKFVVIVCQTLEIEPQHLTKPKPIQGFDDRAAQLVIYIIYPILFIGSHIENLVSLLITKWNHHPMILGRSWMKKYGVLLDMINNCISLSFGYCSQPRVPLVLVPTMPTAETEIISMATQQDILPNQILIRGSAENIDDFLKILEKISKKKRRLINASKRKLAL